MDIAQRVLQFNSFWAHAENITIAMLSDHREEVRRKAVLWIMRARREFDEETNPRKFSPPEVDFTAQNYFDLIDWESEDCTEPPLTMGMSTDEILAAFKEPLILPPFPNHTQAVERMVRVTSEVAPQRVGYTARHRLILKLLESRDMVPKFYTKKHDNVF